MAVLNNSMSMFANFTISVYCKSGASVCVCVCVCVCWGGGGGGGMREREREGGGIAAMIWLLS